MVDGAMLVQEQESACVLALRPWCLCSVTWALLWRLAAILIGRQTSTYVVALATELNLGFIIVGNTCNSSSHEKKKERPMRMLEN